MQQQNPSVPELIDEAEKLGLSLVELCRRLEIHTATLYRYRQEPERMRLGTYRALLQILSDERNRRSNIHGSDG